MYIKLWQKKLLMLPIFETIEINESQRKIKFFGKTNNQQEDQYKSGQTIKVAQCTESWEWQNLRYSEHKKEDKVKKRGKKEQ